MSKHTPGPWAIGPSHNDEYLGPPGELAIMGGDGACVAVAIPTGARGDRLPELTAANARLIAAAPDLLAALRCFLNDDRFQVAVGGNPNAVDRMLEFARAAITKATTP